MSNFSRGAPHGGSNDGEKEGASSVASEKEESVEGAPPPAPAVVVSRVVNVSWERRPPSTTTQPRVQPPAPPVQRITAPMQSPVVGQTPPPVLDDDEPPTDPNFESRGARRTTGTSHRPSVFDPQTSPSIEATFDKLLNDVDASFDHLMLGSSAPASGRAGTEADLADVRELFAQLAAKHMRPVRDFMIDLKWGEAAQTWLAVSAPAVISLRGAAERLQLPELGDALDGFAHALEAAAVVKLPTVIGDARAMLLKAYERLEEVMPEAFGLEVDHTQRESVIVHSLLLQVPGVRKQVIDKLYAAGLSSLEPMFAAKAEDVVATTGIDPKLARRIVERFQDYRKEIKSAVPDATRAAERERLAQLVKRVRHQHDEFEKASAEWSDDAASRKKAMREARAATLLEVNVVLARLGEVERLKTLERLPFGKKVEELELFVEEAEKTFAH